MDRSEIPCLPVETSDSHIHLESRVERVWNEKISVGPSLQLIIWPGLVAMGQVAGSVGSVFRQKYMSNELNVKGKRHSPASFDVSRHVQWEVEKRN